MVEKDKLIAIKREYDSEKPYGSPKIRIPQGEIYAKHTICLDKQVSNEIKKMIEGDQPCLIGRLGENELRAMISGLCDDYPVYLWKRHQRNIEHDGFFNGAGFFPRNINLLPKYADIMMDTCRMIDMLGVWFNRYEDLVIENICDKNVKLCNLGMLEPYSDMPNPWSEVLEGKKVLIIHPFSESIIRQYKNRQKLFDSPKILPQMDIKILKAVQTIAGEKDKRFKNWFEALDYMHNETLKIDYDIAILGCGAYGLPLAGMMKKNGKKVIHLGGATQIMFGIKGARWDNNINIKSLYNEHWVYPLKDERPKKVNSVENGCYWM